MLIMKSKIFIMIFVMLSFLIGCGEKEEKEHVSVTEKEGIIESESVVHQKESTEVKMTTEEEVLSVAINYVVDLRKEFVGKVELLYINESILASVVDRDEGRYLNIVPVNLLKNYLNSFEKDGQNSRDDKLENLFNKLELNYKYVKGDLFECINNWYKDNGIDKSDISRTEKEKHNLFKRCYINKPVITIATVPVFNDEKDFALIEASFFYSEGELSDSQKPYLSGTSVIVLKKIRGKWSVVFHDDMYFGEKVLGPATQQSNGPQ